MTEGTTASADRQRFQTNPAMDAAIEGKLAAAYAAGVNLSAMITASSEEAERIYAQIGYTSEEVRYMGEKAVAEMVLYAIGEKVVGSLAANGIRVARNDLVRSIETYFERCADETEESLSQPLPDLKKVAERQFSVAIDDTTEAQVLHDALVDLGLYPAFVANRRNSRLTFGIDENTKPGAVDLARIVVERMKGDEFHEDMLHAIGNVGDVYVDNPGTDAQLKTASAADVIKAVSAAGFSPLVLDWKGEIGVQLVFDHDEHSDRDLAASDLVRILTRRYRDEPKFRADVLNALYREGPVAVFSDQ